MNLRDILVRFVKVTHNCGFFAAGTKPKLKRKFVKIIFLLIFLGGLSGSMARLH